MCLFPKWISVPKVRNSELPQAFADPSSLTAWATLDLPQGILEYGTRVFMERQGNYFLSSLALDESGVVYRLVLNPIRNHNWNVFFFLPKFFFKQWCGHLIFRCENLPAPGHFYWRQKPSSAGLAASQRGAEATDATAAGEFGTFHWLGLLMDVDFVDPCWENRVSFWSTTLKWIEINDWASWDTHFIIPVAPQLVVWVGDLIHLVTPSWPSASCKQLSWQGTPNSVRGVTG